ncbi:cytochrome P450 [Mycena rebaudengoi]|nr:cytochrome P450 [Mycena rebaudengoi]
MDFSLFLWTLVAFGVLCLLVVGRGLVWLINLLLVAPLFDPLRNLPGPDGSRFQNISVPRIWSHDYRLISFDLRVVSHVLNSEIYEKPWQTRSYLSRLLGRGVFNMEGAEHKYLRKLIGPAFTPHVVKGMTPIFIQKAEELRDRWDDLISGEDCGLASGVSSSTVDVAHWISRMTFDVFGLAGFDYHFNALNDESEEVYMAYRRMFAISDKSSKLRVLKQLYLPFVEKIWPDEDEKATQDCKRIIRNCGMGLIQAKRQIIMAEKLDFRYEEKDILSLLKDEALIILFPVKADLSTAASRRLSDSDLLDQLSSFLFAGSDSTALAYPEIQDRLRTEIMTAPDTTGSKRNSMSSVSSTSSLMQIDTLEALHFLDGVVRETLRLIPPVHGTVRVATIDDLIPVSESVVLRDGKIIREDEHIQIRKGSFVHIPIEGISLSEDIWGSDARQFNPDRWRSLPLEAQPPTFPGLANVMAFSFGPHSCPGHRFSLAEIKVTIGTLLPQFCFSPVDGLEIGKYNSVLTRPFIRDQLATGGIQLPLRVRKFTG